MAADASNKARAEITCFSTSVCERFPMKANMTIIVLIGCFCWFDNYSKAWQEGRDAQIRDEEKRLEGTWTILRYTVNGEEFGLPKDPVEVVFAGKEFKIIHMGQVSSHGKFSIDPIPKPKAIDIAHADKQFQGKKGLGIYDFKSDELWLAIARAGESERPNDFSCKKRSEHGVMVLKRSIKK